VLVIDFDYVAIGHQEFVPSGHMVKQLYYQEILQCLFHQKYPE
jgi:hypothetical protein